MKKSMVSMVAVAAALAVAGTAQAQTSPFSVEVRAGLALPQGDDMEGIESGITVGADALYQINPMFAVYAGYNFNSFGVDCEGDVDCEDADPSVEIKGFDAGLRVNFPMTGVTPFVRGGVVYNSFGLTVDGDGGDFDVETDEELGFEVGGGIELPLGQRLSFTPAVSYTSVEDASYIKVDAGLRIRL